MMNLLDILSTSPHYFLGFKGLKLTWPMGKGPGKLSSNKIIYKLLRQARSGSEHTKCGTTLNSIFFKPWRNGYVLRQRSMVAEIYNDVQTSKVMLEWLPLF